MPVLLCTESGGEGRNIQFCNTLINFDIPWNPMAIEQRIGRIDRIGQTREVFVFNLVTARHPGGSGAAHPRREDQHVRAGGRRGRRHPRRVEEEQDFSDLVLDAWLEATEAGRAQALDELAAGCGGAAATTRTPRQLDDELFGENFEAA